MAVQQLSALRPAHGFIGWRLPAACLLAVLLMALAVQQSGSRLGAQVHEDWVTLHLLLELFAVGVSGLVVLVSWHSRRVVETASLRNLLIAGFSLTGLLDLAHALSYEGMPPLLTPNSMEKTIFFWLGGRCTELLTLGLLAARVGLPGRPGQALGLGLALFALLLLIGCYRLDGLPRTFVPGQGVTALKSLLEYLLAIGFLATAVWLWRQHTQQPDDVTLRRLGLAAFLMAMAEIGFARFLSAADLVHLLGHVYKVLAYALICQAWLVGGLQEPFAQLQASERSLREREADLSAMLNGLPVAVARFDPQMVYRYVNAGQSRLLKRAVSAVVSRPAAEVLPADVMQRLRPHFAQALGGAPVEFELERPGADGRPSCFLVRLVPERDEQGRVTGVLAGTLDTTEREEARRALVDSLREVAGLQRALDAHAIVAVTDANDVIVEVNDKFCQLSQYSRGELIGQSHRLLNAGHHPADFFAGLWQTVSSGLVWQGEICNRAKDGSLFWVSTTIVPFLGEDGRPLQYLTIRADVTERKRAEQEASHLALHDALTGLANRRLMLDQLGPTMTMAATQRRVGALMLLDLDHFKEVNDTLGHPIGDELLRQAAERLRHAVRGDDLIARLGGDEFIVLFAQLGEDMASAARQADERAERLRQTLAEPYLLQGQHIKAPPSIGIALFDGEALQPDELLKRADLALYKAKADGRNCFRHYDPSLASQASERSTLLRELHLALEREELRLHYQPVVDRQGQMLGVEALVRWQHPQRGLLAPGLFIPLAEQSGLVEAIGAWVLETACRQLALWAEQPGREPLSIAVNVSARQFHDAQLVEQVKAVLQRTAANPSRLRLELTESMLHADLDKTIAKMAALRAAGVRFSLDDFGTGYSSLAYLKQLPLDQIKIDRSFVKDLLTDANDAAIVRAILGMAASLELSVVAEGVEQAAQRDALAALGCQAFQGYYFGRPVPVDELPA